MAGLPKSVKIYSRNVSQTWISYSPNFYLAFRLRQEASVSVIWCCTFSGSYFSIQFCIDRSSLKLESSFFESSPRRFFISSYCSRKKSDSTFLSFNEMTLRCMKSKRASSLAIASCSLETSRPILSSFGEYERTSVLRWWTSSKSFLYSWLNWSFILWNYDLTSSLYVSHCLSNVYCLAKNTSNCSFNTSFADILPSTLNSCYFVSSYLFSTKSRTSAISLRTFASPVSMRSRMSSISVARLSSLNTTNSSAFNRSSYLSMSFLWAITTSESACCYSNTGERSWPIIFLIRVSKSIHWISIDATIKWL